MKAFSLKIVTPEGVQFDGAVEHLTVRTTTGDVGILAGHVNYVAALGKGNAAVVADGQKRFAVCNSGVISVMSGTVTLLAADFAWKE